MKMRFRAVWTDGKLTRWKRQTEDLEGLVRHQYRPLSYGICPDEADLNVNRQKKTAHLVS